MKAYFSAPCGVDDRDEDVYVTLKPEDCSEYLLLDLLEEKGIVITLDCENEGNEEKAYAFAIVKPRVKEGKKKKQP